MSITSKERKKIVSELASFNKRVNEVRNRFYNFLVENDPKGYATFMLEAYKGGYPVSVEKFEPVLNDTGLAGLYFEATVDPSEPNLYMIAPDEFLDNPDAWEGKILNEMELDRRMADRAVAGVFGDDAPNKMSYTSKRSMYSDRSEFVEVVIDKDTIPGPKWEVFKNLTPLNEIVVSVSRQDGKVFEGTAPTGCFGSPTRGRNLLATVENAKAV